MSVTINGTTGIITPATTTDQLTTDAITYAGVQAPGLFQSENRIINGAFDFWQRGTSQTTNGYGSADRWQNVLSGGTVTMSRQSFTIGDIIGSNSPFYFLRQTVSGQTLASHFAYIVQRIEGVRSYAGQTITVLGWARRSSGTGNMAINFTQGFGTGGSPSGFVNTSGQTVTLSPDWEPFAVTVDIPSITGKTLGSDGNNFLQLNFWTSGGSDVNAATNSLGLQTIGVDLWGIHIRRGTHTASATLMYVQPEFAPELVRCQRYYEIIRGAMWAAASGSSLSVAYAIPYVVIKRATPTVTRLGDYITSSESGTTVSGVSNNTHLTLSRTTGTIIGGVFTADAEL